ncbi:MtrAB system histidine kinase MtrB [Actinomyces radicidentis]|nr:MtrAB system histidine kinase MtrB [Actinomyces radicidentis]
MTSSPGAPTRRPLPRWLPPRLRRLVLAVRRSLSTRMALLATAAGIVLIALLLTGVTSRVRDDVFNDRRDAVLADARQRVATVQAEFDDTTVTTADEAAAAVQYEVSRIKGSSSGTGGVGVVMLRSGSDASSAAINDLATDTRLSSLVTPELEKAVDDAAVKGDTGAQFWQSVSVPAASGDGTAPGIIVGSRASLPVAGDYDLYLVYSLEPEQRLISTAARAIELAGVGFLLILILGVWGLTWRVLIPVRRTSLAAQRLASGLLSERLAVAGEDELAALARSFNDMADALESQIKRLENLSELQRLFVSDVSHELRTPLSSIRLASEQIMDARDEINDPFAVRSIEILQDQVDRFTRMLEDLLAISRIDSGRVQLSVEETDLRAVVERVVGDLGVQIEERSAVVTIAPAPEPLIAEMDAVRVERIVRNFVTNALDHAKEGEPPRIDVTLAGTDTIVAVRVRDHGVGMSPDVLGKVFDRFYRADPSRKRTLGGTGLGLSISLEDAHLHGGTLENWGWPGDGSAFLMVLPRSLGPDGTPGVLTGAWPLGAVPDDAPVVSRSTSRRDPAAPAPSSAIGPVPVSRRAEGVHHDDEDDETPTAPTAPTPDLAAEPRGGARPVPPPAAGRRVTVRVPGDAPSARTPDAPKGGAR